MPTGTGEAKPHLLRKGLVALLLRRPY